MQDANCLKFHHNALEDDVHSFDKVIPTSVEESTISKSDCLGIIIIGIVFSSLITFI